MTIPSSDPRNPEPVTDASLLDRAQILITQAPCWIPTNDQAMTRERWAEWMSEWRKTAYAWMDDWEALGGFLRHDEIGPATKEPQRLNRYDDKGTFDTLPIATGRNHDGEDVQFVETFVCHICGKPAEHLPIRHCEAHGPSMDITRRTTSMTVERLYYACSDHIEDVADQVCHEHGWSTNDGPMEQPTFRRN